MTEKEVLTFVQSLEEQAMARWNNAMGTPTSLREAIRNGMNDIRYVKMDNPEDIILKHVKDFLSQKFTPFMAGDGSVPDCTATALWERIIKNED